MEQRLILLFVLLFVFCLDVNAGSKEQVKFVKCVDGDTAVFNNGENIKVRFLAIDTPETVHPTKVVEAYGKNASDYTCNKIKSSKNIVLEYDDGSTKLDKYNRVLAWVWVDDSLLQKELIEIGYAKVKYIYGNYLYTDELYDAEEIAKNNEVGLWNDYTPVTYIVSFDEDVKINKVKILENTLVKEYTPKKNGYKFMGWYLNDKKFDFNTRVTSNITLKAKYEREYTKTELLVLCLIVISGLILKKQKKLKKLI